MKKLFGYFVQYKSGDQHLTCYPGSECAESALAELLTEETSEAESKVIMKKFYKWLKSKKDLSDAGFYYTFSDYVSWILIQELTNVEIKSITNYLKGDKKCRIQK